MNQESPFIQLPAAEAALVAGLLDSTRVHLSGTSLCVLCTDGTRKLCFAPRDEIGASRRANPEEVVRLSIEACNTTAFSAGFDDFDVVIDAPLAGISILQTAVRFHVPEPAPAETVRGTSVPAGQFIAVDVGHPDRYDVSAPAGSVVNLVDSAICFLPAWGDPVVVGTDGWAFCLSVASGANAEKWMRECRAVPIGVRLRD